MKITNTIEIRTTPETVFYWLGDPSRAVQWMTSVSHTEIIKKTPNWIGTTFRETVEENGRGTDLHGEVIDFEENKRLVFHLEGDFNTVEVTWLLRQRGDFTEVVQQAELRFKGFLRIMSIVIGPLLKKKIKAQARGEFATLKELCERDQASTPDI